LGGDIADPAYLGFIDMPVGEMLEQIAKNIDTQFFFEGICA